MKNNIIKFITIALATLTFFLSMVGCDSVSTRTMSIPTEIVSIKMIYNKDKIIEAVKEIVISIANKHGFTEDDLVTYKAFEGDGSKYLLHRVRIIKRPVARDVKDNISLLYWRTISFLKYVYTD